MKITEGMEWPIKDLQRVKMNEHSAWYSGDPTLLYDFYSTYATQDYLGVTNRLPIDRNSFWGRQSMSNSKTKVVLHVPIASDISETSASFLFSESPIIRINKVAKQGNDGMNTNTEKDQEELDKMLVKTSFFQRLLEAAETASAIGGVFIKIAWDSKLSPYPLPVIEQQDNAYPTFKFGMLQEVTFVHTYPKDKNSSKVLRLFETYEKGKIRYEAFIGTDTNVGTQVSLADNEETKGLADFVDTSDMMLAVYVPNLLPNRLERTSKLGRSDYSGIEQLMDRLDEVFTCWIRDIEIARGRIHIPEVFLDIVGDKTIYDEDQDVYIKTQVDPTLQSGESITATQFAIRADEFEKTILNLLDRIITSAGYSPQSFGLNIQGRAESGVALDIRERKSFSTTNKKEAYWEPAIKQLVEGMCVIYTTKLGGKLKSDIDINVSFADGITNNLPSVASSIKLLSDAQAISTDTKVRMTHPEWTDKQVLEEVDKILNENKQPSIEVPDGFDNPDIEQVKNDLGDWEDSKEE